MFAGADGAIRTLDPTKIDQTIDGNEIAAHPAGHVALAVDGRGAFAASGGVDGVLRIFDLGSRVPGGLSTVGRAAGGKVYDLATSAAATRILEGGVDGTARVWKNGASTRLREVA